MNLRLSKETAELLIVICLVGIIPVAFFTPQLPATLVFLYGANAAFLVYALYQLNLYMNPEHEDPLNTANLKKNILLVNQKLNTTPTIAQAKTSDDTAATPEQRTAQEIIMAKLNDGAIEKAIDKQFDTMIQDVVKDLFSSYGGVSTQIKTKLKENMNPYIEQYDFAQHNVKLEMLLNAIVTDVTKDQTQIIKNMRTLMGLDPVNEITTEEMFAEYANYAAKNVDTGRLEVDTDDHPTYENLTLKMDVTNQRSYGASSEIKQIEFTCEQDENLNITVELRRWTDIGDGKWNISSVVRPERKDDFENVPPNRVSDLNNPVSALKEMDDLDVFFVKLYQDRAAVTINETFLEDEDVQVEEEPEVSFS